VRPVEPRPHGAPPRIVGRKVPPPPKGNAGDALRSHPNDERPADDCAECSHLAGFLVMDRADLRRYAAVAAAQADESGEPSAHALHRIAWLKKRINERVQSLNDHPEHRRS